MHFSENGLEIAIFPPKGEKIAPGDNITTRVSITNKRHQLGIRLAIFLELKPELKSWCSKQKHSLTIGYQQSQEIEFYWNIPVKAAAGTHTYHLRIEFLRSTSFYSIQPKIRQLTILPTVVTPQINRIEPSFTITPASSSTQPLSLSSGEALNLEIDVSNRSNKTDNFRVSTDLETAWYVVRYPETIKKVGAIEGSEALNLNPGEKGKIYLKVTPPADAVAGNYKPEIKLHSLNSPDLFLKKITYLNIPPRYLLQTEIQVILDRVSQKNGQYKIALDNKGNTFRKIELRVQSSDENECCDYFLDTNIVRLAPKKAVEVKLEVKPNARQKRPFLRSKQFNFQVDLIDKNDYPLPKDRPLKSSLFWRSRPIWQLILLCLAIIGVLGGCFWVIRWLFFAPKPKAQVTLKSEKSAYSYGEKIALNWAIENPQEISKVELFDKALGEDSVNTQCYVFDEAISTKNCLSISQEDLPNNCQSNSKIISCSDIIFRHAKAVKDYTFILRAIPKRGEPVVQEAKVSILEKPSIEIIEPLKTSKQESQPNEPISLSFEVSKIEHLVGKDRVFLLVNNERQTEPIITPQNVNEVCSQAISDRYLCEVNLPQLAEGENTVGIELQYDTDGRKNRQPQKFNLQNPITVKTPITLNYFRINNSDSGTLEVEAGTPITVSWFVTGKNAKVNLDCVGGQLALQGTKTLNVPEGVTQTCTLEILDDIGQTIDNRTLGVKVKEAPKLEELEEEKTKPLDIFE